MSQQEKKRQHLNSLQSLNDVIHWSPSTIGGGQVADACSLDTGVHVQMFRSSGQSDGKPPVFSSQSSLVLIYRPTDGMKG
ncbi:hypothetical protein TNCV_2675931 [Trichonephila clavipes]|nr:hypothetical protein TNCV_2675931 [Trichonephila clavipes]